MSEIKENIVNGASKKQIKELSLKTLDVEKYFVENKDVQVARPRIYPPVDVNSKADDTLMPQNN